MAAGGDKHMTDFLRSKGCCSWKLGGDGADTIKSKMAPKQNTAASPASAGLDKVG